MGGDGQPEVGERRVLRVVVEDEQVGQVVRGHPGPAGQPQLRHAGGEEEDGDDRLDEAHRPGVLAAGGFGGGGFGGAGAPARQPAVHRQRVAGARQGEDAEDQHEDAVVVVDLAEVVGQPEEVEAEQEGAGHRGARAQPDGGEQQADLPQQVEDGEGRGRQRTQVEEPEEPLGRPEDRRHLGPRRGVEPAVEHEEAGEEDDPPHREVERRARREPEARPAAGEAAHRAAAPPAPAASASPPAGGGSIARRSWRCSGRSRLASVGSSRQTSR
jgi:hypothetical protein